LSLETPARGEKFFDRDEEVRLISSYIARGEHVIVVGLRKVGKTSILFRLADVLAEDHLILYYYVPETKNLRFYAAYAFLLRSD